MAQMVPQQIVETIDVKALQAANIVVGRVTQVETNGSETSATIAAEATLKGDPADRLRREVTVKGRMAPQAVTTMLIQKSRVLAVGSVLLPLDTGELVVPTARGKLLRDPQTLLDYVAEVLRTYPEGGPIQIFQQPMPQDWKGIAFPSALMTFGFSGMNVPVGPDLKQWALNALRSGMELEKVSQALGHFKTPETIAELRALLNSPEYVVLREQQLNSGIEVRSFPARQAAYDVLVAWGVTVKAPEFREEVPRDAR
jgi:hypothetical protein